jgi:tyrosyl-tRNA synthetase
LDDFQQLELDGLEVARIESDAGLLAAMTDAGITKSRGEARNLVKSGGVSVNSISVSDESHLLTRSDALFNKYQLIRRGKKNFKLLVLENS